MAEDQGQDRTEAPTPRRRDEALHEGRIPRSAEVSAATALLAGTVLLAAAGGGSLADFATRMMRECAGALSTGPMSTAGAVAALRGLGLGLVEALLPFLAGLGLAVTAANLSQTHGIVTTKPLNPDLNRINPFAGFKRIAGAEAVITLLKSIVKIAVLGTVTWLVLRRAWPEVLSLPEIGAAGIAAVMRQLVLRLAVIAGLAFLVVAAVDYVVQRVRWERSLRMTRSEVQHEARDTEGDPHVKARLRSVARARARRRMLQQVPTADVVVVNPTRIAVALRYDISVSPAPIVVAMGQRKLAERIRELARRSGVPILENPPVARALFATGTVGKPIPPTLYAAVAEILAWVYRQRMRAGRSLPWAR